MGCVGVGFDDAVMHEPGDELARIFAIVKRPIQLVIVGARFSYCRTDD
jgi:hypothetical protein